MYNEPKFDRIFVYGHVGTTNPVETHCNLLNAWL